MLYSCISPWNIIEGVNLFVSQGSAALQLYLCQTSIIYSADISNLATSTVTSLYEFDVGDVWKPYNTSTQIFTACKLSIKSSVILGFWYWAAISCCYIFLMKYVVWRTCRITRELFIVQRGSFSRNYVLFQVVVGLWLFSVIGSIVSFFTLAYIGMSTHPCRFSFICAFVSSPGAYFFWFIAPIGSTSILSVIYLYSYTLWLGTYFFWCL